MRKRTMLYLGGIVMLAVASGGVSGPAAAFATEGHGHTPVTICHHGKTLTVDDSAVPGHVRHGDTLGACTTPEPPTTTPEPTTPAAVVEPQVQDYVTCTGAAFVLDNTSSTVPVRYMVAGKPFDVPAGTAVHTDADGYQFPADIGPYTVTTYPGDRAWTFAPPAGCEPTTPPTPVTTPVVGEPVLGITPANCFPTPDEAVKVVTWDIPTGLAIGGVTGKGSAADEAADILRAATSGGGGTAATPRFWVLPVTVLDGYTYTGPAAVTLRQGTDAPNGDLTKCPTTTMPPTGEPSIPAPSGAPTTPAPALPSPTAGTTPPASSPSGTPASTPPASSSGTTPTRGAVPVAASTSDGTPRELAYTGAEGIVGGSAAALGLLALGAFVLVMRSRARRSGGDA